MLLLPVLDLLNGVVVRGVGGLRETYRPIVSSLTADTGALEVARAFRTVFKLHSLYVADLDAIVHRRPRLDTYRELVREGFQLLVDAGVQDPDQARAVADCGACRVIVGLESSPGPESLREIVGTLGADRVVFSVDLQGGQPLAGPGGWAGLTPFEIACQALQSGVDGLIVLDLAGVGVGAGVGTSELCLEILREHPTARLITGGGVRNRVDLAREAQLGAAAVLVASALHDGRLLPADTADYRHGWPAAT